MNKTLILLFLLIVALWFSLFKVNKEYFGFPDDSNIVSFRSDETDENWIDIDSTRRDELEILFEQYASEDIENPFSEGNIERYTERDGDGRLSEEQMAVIRRMTRDDNETGPRWNTTGNLPPIRLSRRVNFVTEYDNGQGFTSPFYEANTTIRNVNGDKIPHTTIRFTDDRSIHYGAYVEDGIELNREYTSETVHAIQGEYASNTPSLGPIVRFAASDASARRDIRGDAVWTDRNQNSNWDTTGIIIDGNRKTLPIEIRRTGDGTNSDSYREFTHRRRVISELRDVVGTERQWNVGISNSTSTEHEYEMPDYLTIYTSPTTGIIYEITSKPIGSGVMAQVYKVTITEPGKAPYDIIMRADPGLMLSTHESAFNIFERLNGYDNFLRYYEVMLGENEPYDTANVWIDNQWMYTFMEYADGDLSSLIVGKPGSVDAIPIDNVNSRRMDNTKLSIDNLHEIGTQLFNGLKDLQTERILHKDIHPGNIFFVRNTDGTYDVKIADFDQSVIIWPDSEGSDFYNSKDVHDMLIVLRALINSGEGENADPRERDMLRLIDEIINEVLDPGTNTRGGTNRSLIDMDEIMTRWNDLETRWKQHYDISQEDLIEGRTNGRFPDINISLHDINGSDSANDLRDVLAATRDDPYSKKIVTLIGKNITKGESSLLIKHTGDTGQSWYEIRDRSINGRFIKRDGPTGMPFRDKTYTFEFYDEGGYINIPTSEEVRSIGAGHQELDPEYYQMDSSYELSSSFSDLLVEKQKILETITRKIADGINHRGNILYSAREYRQPNGLIIGTQGFIGEMIDIEIDNISYKYKVEPIGGGTYGDIYKLSIFNSDGTSIIHEFVIKNQPTTISARTEMQFEQMMNGHPNKNFTYGYMTYIQEREMAPPGTKNRNEHEIPWNITVRTLMVSDLQSGNLYNGIENGEVTVNNQLFIKMANIISEIQQLGIIDNDVKPQNFLYNNIGDIFITDMGSALMINDQLIKKGTPGYMPNRNTLTTFRYDIYSLGKSFLDLMNIDNKNPKIPVLSPENIGFTDEQFRSLIDGMMNEDYRNRIDIDTVIGYLNNPSTIPT